MKAVLVSAYVVSCWASYMLVQDSPLFARDDLVIRLCYEITEMGNEYAEDVQGIYSPHYQDSEGFTRLVKWEAVAKLADASAEAGPSGGIAAPWSSVNNCTGSLRSEDSTPPGCYEKLDFEGMSRKERRQLLNRIRADQPEKRHLKLRRPDKVEAACDKVISQVRDLSCETISRGEAVRLLSGAQTEIGGRMFRSAYNGELFRPRAAPEPSRILERFNLLAEQARAKMRFEPERAGLCIGMAGR